MALVEFNKETCTKCGICATICSAGIIYQRKNSYPRLFPGSADICLRCGHCVAVCPTGSVIHEEIPLSESPEIRKLSPVSFTDYSLLIKSRRSVREFKDKAVSSKVIERIIDTARYAPTGHNDQEVRWLVVNDRQKMKELADVGADWMRWTAKNVPGMAEMLVGPIKRLDEGYDVFLRDAPALVAAYAEKDNPIAATDCAIALGYFDLAANSLGLGCCWAGFFYFAAGSFPAMIEAVALPEGMTCYGALMLGYPKYKYQRIPARKPARITYRR
jgi:nitroreductase/NAD-dependent dihydropyrimidine dehydrogenase PreA subunit